MDTKGKIMISCEESTYLSSKKQQDSLSTSEKMQQWLHLMMCKYCRRFSAQINLINKAMLKLKNAVESEHPEIRLTDQRKKRMEEVLRNNQLE